VARPPAGGPVIIPQCVEVHVYWSNGLNTFSNVLHGNHGGTAAINETLAETLLTSFKSALTTSGWGAIVHPTVALYRVGVKDLASAYNSEYLSSGAALAGTGASTPLGDHTALVVTEQTSRSGAQWRGRMYLGGMDAAATNDGSTATQAAVDAAGAFGEAIRSAMSSAQVPMVVAQRELLAGQTAGGTAMPPRAATTVPVTRCIVSDNRLDTQRRRIHR